MDPVTAASNGTHPPILPEGGVEVKVRACSRSRRKRASMFSLIRYDGKISAKNLRFVLIISRYGSTSSLLFF